MAFDSDLQGELLTLLFIAVIAGAILLRVFAWNFLKGMMASGWSITQGRVEFGSVEEHRIRYFTYYISRLDYSYSVNNEYYSGCFARVFLREKSADRFLAAMKGQPIFLRTHPHRPERSATLVRDQPGGWPA